MVVFLTFFLSLTTGAQPVAVAVDGAVARVELQLDGAVVSVMEGEPWQGQVDFGGPLLPHELVAVARDAEGREVGRARQLINLPRPQVEARLVLDQGEDGLYRQASLRWDSVQKLNIERLSVSLDGQPLAIEDPRAIGLPPYERQRQHLLVAEVVFAGDRRAEAVATFGGRFGDRVGSELSAVAVTLNGGRKLPPAEEMEGWFLHRGRPCSVFAVDRPPADVFVVRDREAIETLRALLPGRRRTSRRTLSGSGSSGESRGTIPPVRRSLTPVLPGVRLDPEDRVYFIHPVVDREASRSAGVWLFPILGPYQPAGRRFLHGSALLGDRAPELEESEVVGEPQRLADAVAVAGLRAAAGRERAVVLMVDPRSDDASALGWPSVRGYLSALRVPLRVWSTEKLAAEDSERWGADEVVSSTWRFQKALDRLRKTLDSQRIVWLEGSLLPQEIELSAVSSQHLTLAH